MKSTQISARSWRTVTVTIPAAVSDAVTIESLIASSLRPGEAEAVVGVAIDGLDSSGANRGELAIGDVAGTTPQRVAAGADFFPPAFDWWKHKTVRAASGAAISNVVVEVYLA